MDDDYGPFGGFGPEDTYGYGYGYQHEGPALAPDPERLTHLVFLDGRLIDAWGEEVAGTRYAAYARRSARERRPTPPPPPPPPPQHEQVLTWLDGIAGSRDAVLTLVPDPEIPPLRGALDPVADESWLVVDEILAGVVDDLLTPDLEAPLRRGLLLLRGASPQLIERTEPDRIAAGLIWVVGKANAAIGPSGPVTQTSIARHLGLSGLGGHGSAVLGHLRRRALWSTYPPRYDHDRRCPDLLSTGRPELLSPVTAAQLIVLRDDALAAEHASRAGISVLPSAVES